MGNPKHLAKLEEGVDAWNKWRLEDDWADIDLSKADLHDANLCAADLRGVDLRGANLSAAILHEADLNGAILSGAVFYETVIGNVDLKGVVGLSECKHMGPSVIDHRTLAESGPLPLIFLRGCGLPDQFIDYIPSLFNQAIQFHSCFISYSNKDQPFADRLHADLQDKGVRCWFAPHDIAGGKKTRTN